MHTDIKPVRACGCIPYRTRSDGEIEVLMVRNRGKHGHWVFPKGKQEEGETDEETAKRELYEETGLVGVPEEVSIPEFSYSYTKDGQQYHKTQYYFLCSVDTDAQEVIQEEEIDDHGWFTLDEIEARATYEDMKKVARECIPHIRAKTRT